VILGFAVPLFQPWQFGPSKACFGRALALAGWQDWSESFWWIGGRHIQFNKLVPVSETGTNYALTHPGTFL